MNFDKSEMTVIGIVAGIIAALMFGLMLFYYQSGGWSVSRLLRK